MVGLAQTPGWDTPEEAMVKESEKGQLAKRCTCLLMTRCVRRSIDISDLDQGIEILDERLPEPATYEVKLCVPCVVYAEVTKEGNLFGDSHASE